MQNRPKSYASNAQEMQNC